ncbi:hypothetical protein F2Q70_00040420 [Brassica cretica]|uniref:Uncharacterized protein n=1 Tax=Brassica cretica TaxID=69181 RepID=A0A8S9KBK2_BRACR|nr:hypothetical protein F2Q70_00040420 [Brassica cretica]
MKPKKVSSLSLSPSSLSRDLLSRPLRRLCRLSLASPSLSVRRLSPSVVSLAPSSQWMTRAVFSVDPSSLSIHLLRRLSRSGVSLDACVVCLPLSSLSIQSMRIGVVWKRQWNPRESLRDGFNFIKARG